MLEFRVECSPSISSFFTQYFIFLFSECTNFTHSLMNQHLRFLCHYKQFCHKYFYKCFFVHTQIFWNMYISIKPLDSRHLRLNLARWYQWLLTVVVTVTLPRTLWAFCLIQLFSSICCCQIFKKIFAKLVSIKLNFPDDYKGGTYFPKFIYHLCFSFILF